jgi:hypothetical protein
MVSAHMIVAIRSQTLPAGTRFRRIVTGVEDTPAGTQGRRRLTANRRRR